MPVKNAPIGPSIGGGVVKKKATPEAANISPKRTRAMMVSLFMVPPFFLRMAARSDKVKTESKGGIAKCLQSRPQLGVCFANKVVIQLVEGPAPTLAHAGFGFAESFALRRSGFAKNLPDYGDASSIRAFFCKSHRG